jgi:hypothetical protein
MGLYNVKNEVTQPHPWGLLAQKWGVAILLMTDRRHQRHSRHKNGWQSASHFIINA